jgi:hypothetical protein
MLRPQSTAGKHEPFLGQNLTIRPGSERNGLVVDP